MGFERVAGDRDLFGNNLSCGVPIYFERLIEVDLFKLSGGFIEGSVGIKIKCGCSIGCKR